MCQARSSYLNSHRLDIHSDSPVSQTHSLLTIYSHKTPYVWKNGQAALLRGQKYSLRGSRQYHAECALERQPLFAHALAILIISNEIFYYDLLYNFMYILDRNIRASAAQRNFLTFSVTRCAFLQALGIRSSVQRSYPSKAKEAISIIISIL